MQQMTPEVGDVRAAHRFDEAALHAYLRARLPGIGAELEVRQFEGGQSNPTFLLESAGTRYVLRKKPPGTLLPTAHLVEREHRVLSALAGTAVPVPRTWLLCEDAGVIGTAFYVMDWLDGRIFRDPRLPDLPPATRSAIYEELARVLAAVHGVDYAAAGLGDFGRPGGYVERQIRRWTRQYEASRTDDIPAMDRLIEWLPAHLPDDDATCLVHGDYRIDNLVFDAREPRVVGVLDWELSTLGHPLSDLAYVCMAWRNDAPGRPRLHGPAGDDPGIPAEEDFVAAYCRHAGRAGVEHWPYYLAFSFFRIASILQGVYRRGLEGNASSAHALERGRQARFCAETGWRIASEGGGA